jgi:hypothetical protein
MGEQLPLTSPNTQSRWPEATPMTTRLHFISGLPRSGSTLLAGILRGTFDLLHGDPKVLEQEVKRGRVHIATPGEPFGVS